MLTKVCTKCGEEKPADDSHFYRQPHGRHQLTALCRKCHKQRMVAANASYYSANREKELIRHHTEWDRKRGLDCNLTVEWFKQNLSSKPCLYCGTADEPIGADRIDNSIGHMIGNVVPCCQTCNKVRNNLFTVDEMRMLGAVIRKIKALRRIRRVDAA